MIISFKLHKINTEIIKAVIDSKASWFQFKYLIIIKRICIPLAKRINLSNSFSEFQLYVDFTSLI